MLDCGDWNFTKSTTFPRQEPQYIVFDSVWTVSFVEELILTVESILNILATICIESHIVETQAYVQGAGVFRPIPTDFVYTFSSIAPARVRACDCGKFILLMKTVAKGCCQSFLPY